jgi:hypothetical protein
MDPMMLEIEKNGGIVIAPTDWLVVVSTKDSRDIYPIDMVAVFIGGFAADPIHLRDALIMFGKGKALSRFKRHGSKQTVELVSSWSRLAQTVKRNIFVIEEMSGVHEDAFGMRALYMVTTDGKAGFFLTRDQMHVMKLAS